MTIWDKSENFIASCVIQSFDAFPRWNCNLTSLIKYSCAFFIHVWDAFPYSCMQRAELFVEYSAGIIRRPGDVGKNDTWIKNCQYWSVDNFSLIHCSWCQFPRYFSRIYSFNPIYENAMTDTIIHQKILHNLRIK